MSLRSAPSSTRLLSPNGSPAPNNVKTVATATSTSLEGGTPSNGAHNPKAASAQPVRAKASETTISTRRLVRNTRWTLSSPSSWRRATASVTAAPTPRSPMGFNAANPTTSTKIAYPSTPSWDTVTRAASNPATAATGRVAARTAKALLTPESRDVDAPSVTIAAS
jgi:hypothetical protein